MVWVLVGLSWGHIPEGFRVVMEFGEAMQVPLMMGELQPSVPRCVFQPFASSKVGTSGSALGSQQNLPCPVGVRGEGDTLSCAQPGLAPPDTWSQRGWRNGARQSKAPLQG